MNGDGVPATCLVTGGCGFIGSNFVNHISHKWPNTVIVNVDRLTEAADVRNVEQRVVDSGKYHLVVGCIGDGVLMKKLLNEYKIEYVLNFAATSDVDECYREPEKAMENIKEMISLMESCREGKYLKRFVHISTDEVYGESEFGPDARPAQEIDAPHPTNTYAASKAGCDNFLEAYGHSYGLHYVVVRMNNVFGPRQWLSKVVPRFIDLINRGQPLSIQGRGDQTRNWLYAEDACNAIRKVAEIGRLGEFYNIASPNEVSVLDMGQRIYAEVCRQQTSIAHPPFRTVPVPDRPYNDRRYLMNCDKLYKELGWKCEVTFEEGLEKTVRWYLEKKRAESTFLIYGGNGWIGKQIQNILGDCKLKFILAKTRPGTTPEKEVEEELRTIKPTHVICTVGRVRGPGCNNSGYLEGGVEKLDMNLRDNMFAPLLLASLTKKLSIHMTYIGTGVFFQYDDEHVEGGKGYTEEENANFKGNNYSVVKGYTDQLIRHFDHVFNARIGYPFNWEAEPENLVMKVAGFTKVHTVPDCHTSLPHILPVLIHLAQEKYAGTLNLTNSGTLSLPQILNLYKEIVDKDKTWEVITREERMRTMLPKAHSCLDTTKLQALFPSVPTAEDAMREAMDRLADNMKKQRLESRETTKG